jgi:hypothetical protein
MAEDIRDPAENAHRRGDHLGPDPVAGQDDEARDHTPKP